MANGKLRYTIHSQEMQNIFIITYQIRILQDTTHPMEHLNFLFKDKKLKKIIEAQPELAPTTEKHIHLSLCSSIVSQQLSTKVAAIIYQRFLALFSTKNPSPEEIMEIPYDTLRDIGLSNSKVNYIRNVCEYFIEKKIKDKDLRKLSNEDIIKELTVIKGIGRWTVEMLLMFSLGREDVFAVDDLGIQQAMIQLYDLDKSDKKKLKADMLLISEKWAPYRTYACLYLWNWKDS